ncbi:hypothetical protein THAOC_09398 [Thalassiosira oceanica]|uniref:Uncharacterized protein n=1 Tax=Thalassiosira oceanica TaxID=159749 RepID=K0TFQ0_THAOC|nr:hypothetical protein THAOC_09398 [Thalassiosira oceanica]|eukprot:EJK69352.1 hypothetical protein THAOC_09398 [Thalassiosira oceanica]
MQLSHQIVLVSAHHHLCTPSACLANSSFALYISIHAPQFKGAGSTDDVSDSLAEPSSCRWQTTHCYHRSSNHIGCLLTDSSSYSPSDSEIEQTEESPSLLSHKAKRGWHRHHRINRLVIHSLCSVVVEVSFLNKVSSSALDFCSPSPTNFWMLEQSLQLRA